MFFDFASLAAKDRYKVLTHVVVPRPIAWVVTMGASGQRNAAPFSFFNVVSTEPPVICLGVSARSGAEKDTARHIAESGQFVVNLVSFSVLSQMNVTAIDFPPSTNELLEARLTVVASAKVAPPRIFESPVALECEEILTHFFTEGSRVVLGRVLAVHVRDEAITDAAKCYIDTAKLDLVGRMQGTSYIRTAVSGVFEHPRLTLPEWIAGGLMAATSRRTGEGSLP